MGIIGQFIIEFGQNICSEKFKLAFMIKMNDISIMISKLYGHKMY